MYKFFILLVLSFSTLYGEWAEKTLKTLLVQEKSGQLFVVPPCLRYDKEIIEQVIDQYHVD